MAKLEDIKGVIFDLDGVLYVGSQVIDGALEAVRRVHESGRKCRFITNTSTLSQPSLQRRITALGFQIPAQEIISAPQAAKLYLGQMGRPVCHLLLADDVKKDFGDVRAGDQGVDAVVLGDIGSAWNHDLLNRVFKMLMEGAKLIAIHKNRFWQTEAGLSLDIGAYVAALEYASGKEAVIIGKPSPEFFRMALLDMALSPEQVVTIGDDIESDIGGAQAVGMAGVLVKTGKYRESYVKSSPVRPDFVIPSVKELPSLLAL